MMANKDGYEITWLVRRLFRAMAGKANEHLASFGISAADRAVLEFLYPDETLSVPEVAKRYDVSRQHVQVTVNRLLAQKLVVAKENPRHKRSPLIALTRKGRNLFHKVRENDKRTVAQLFAGVPAKDRQATQRTLEHLLSQLT